MIKILTILIILLWSGIIYIEGGSRVKRLTEVKRFDIHSGGFIGPYFGECLREGSYWYCAVTKKD